jgi:NAD(P)-dependent dehydrogenase (short-subunit alcohol dehydrogenase family)
VAIVATVESSVRRYFCGNSACSGRGDRARSRGGSRLLLWARSGFEVEDVISSGEAGLNSERGPSFPRLGEARPITGEVAMGVLDAQVAIVTGAGQGIGRGIALAVSKEGAKVVVLGRTLSKCEAVVEEVTARGGVAVAEECNVERRDQVEASVRRCVERWGRIDLLVNNAQSSTTYQPIRQMIESDVDTMWQSGPMGSLRFMQSCFEHLQASQGCVVNLGSGMSIAPPVGSAGYAMTKEAIRVLSRVGAIEWGEFGIRVNAICPMAMSPMIETAEQASPGTAERLAAQIPLKRLGDAEADVGRAVVYLASDAGRYITGTTLMVDGGYRYLR